VRLAPDAKIPGKQWRDLRFLPPYSHTLFRPCHGTSQAKCPFAYNSKQFTDATTVELCLSLSSENAVKTQTWCAIATYVLIAVIEKELQPDTSLYTCLQRRKPGDSPSVNQVATTQEVACKGLENRNSEGFPRHVR
jgi:hypothetical protein